MRTIIIKLRSFIADNRKLLIVLCFVSFILLIISIAVEISMRHSRMDLEAQKNDLQEDFKRITGNLNVLVGLHGSNTIRIKLNSASINELIVTINQLGMELDEKSRINKLTLKDLIAYKVLVEDLRSKYLDQVNVYITKLEIDSIRKEYFISENNKLNAEIDGLNENLDKIYNQKLELITLSWETLTANGIPTTVPEEISILRFVCYFNKCYFQKQKLFVEFMGPGDKVYMPSDFNLIKKQIGVQSYMKNKNAILEIDAGVESLYQELWVKKLGKGKYYLRLRLENGKLLGKTDPIFL